MEKIRKLEVKDINKIAPFYVEYFNTNEGASWTEELAIKRLRQLIMREDNIGLLLEDDHQMIGFAVGQLTQFDDGIVFELNEILITGNYQRKGYGSKLLNAIELNAKAQGAFRIQLITGIDQEHHHFYNEMHGYSDGSNNIQKSKAL